MRAERKLNGTTCHQWVSWVVEQAKNEGLRVSLDYDEKEKANIFRVIVDSVSVDPVLDKILLAVSIPWSLKEPAMSSHNHLLLKASALGQATFVVAFENMFASGAVAAISGGTDGEVPSLESLKSDFQDIRLSVEDGAARLINNSG